MKRKLALAVLALICAAEARAQDLPPGRLYAAQAIGMCLDLHEDPQAKVNAPSPFALNPQGYLLAQDRGILVGIRAAQEYDDEFDEVSGACEVQVEGDVPWFADFAATQVYDLKSLGWDVAEHETGLENGVQTFSLVGYGSIKIRYGVGKPNAMFVMRW